MCCARAPPRACGARGARASAWWRITVALAPTSTPPRWPLPRAGPARTGSASSTRSRSLRAGHVGRAPRSTTAAPGASAASPPLARAAGRCAGGEDAARRGRRRLRLRARRRLDAGMGGVRARVAARARGGAGAPRRAGDADAGRRRRPRRRRRCAARAWSSAPPRCAARRCRCSTPTRPGATAWSARCRPSTTSPRWRARSSASAAGALDKVVLAREVQVHAPRAARRRGGLRRAARGVPVVLHLLRRARGRRVRRRQPRAARAPRRPARRDARAGGLDAPQRRPGGRRPPRRAAAALRQGPRGAGDRDAAHRARAAPGERVGDGGRGAGRRADGQHPAPGDADPRAAARPVSAVELAGLLHPTPAVGGEPFAAAAPLIPALEGLDRGWYAGPVGWTDANEDGEFCVALRCALLPARWPAATRGSAWCATPTRRPSWPRPRSSSRRCCRCWPAERLRPAVREPYRRTLIPLLGRPARSPTSRCQTSGGQGPEEFGGARGVEPGARCLGSMASMTALGGEETPGCAAKARRRPRRRRRRRA